jgi:hypothetical protein
MAHTFNKFGAAFVAASLLLAGCGKSAVMAPVAAEAVPAFSDGMETEATSTLMQGFAKIHQAIFTKLDKDGNKAIDEYEAGPNLSMGDFRAADKNHNNKLTYAEFKKYAITTMFFLKDNPTAFTSRFRRELGDVFKRLDTNHDGVLIKNETSLRDLDRLKLTFEYPRLNIKVKINKIDQATFAAADKTGDSVLGPAEFEDLYIGMVLLALGGAPAPAPNPPAPPAEDPNAPPAVDPNTPPAPAEDPNAPPAPPADPAPKSKKKKGE